MGSLKIVLVHDYLNQYGGAERVLDAFCELFPEAPIYTLLHNKDKIPTHYAKKTITTSFLQKIPFIKKHYEKFIFLYPTAIEQFNFNEFDVVLSDSSAWAKGVITTPHTCHICFCHSPMRFAWDDYHIRLQHLGSSKKILPYIMNYLRNWDVISAQRVDYFIANSSEVRQRIKKYYRREADVIYPPVDWSFFKPTANKDDFYLIVSRLKPYKRLEIAIEAFNELKLPLVIIGSGNLEKKLKALAKHNIKFLKNLPDEEVRDYYSKAQALIFPGLEDFGIAPIEAQACGTPIIAYGRGGVLETVVPYAVEDGNNNWQKTRLQEPSGIFFNQQSQESIINAIKYFQLVKKDFDTYGIREAVKGFDTNIFKTTLKNYIYAKYTEYQTNMSATPRYKHYRHLKSTITSKSV